MPDEAPLKDGDVFRDWDDEIFTAQNVRMIGDGDDWFFDAKYHTDGREVRNFIWADDQFTPMNTGA